MAAGGLRDDPELSRSQVKNTCRTSSTGLRKQPPITALAHQCRRGAERRSLTVIPEEQPITAQLFRQSHGIFTRRGEKVKNISLSVGEDRRERE